MPVFNRANVVRRAVDSVLAQDFHDFELIVVDDGSTDGTAEAIEAIDDPRVRLIRLPSNAGGNAARNRGIREARSPLVSFLDSDDYYLPNKLGWTVHEFADRPEIEAIIDSFIKVYPCGGEKRQDAHRRNPVLDCNEELLSALFNRRIWKATSGISARRDAILRAGLFDESLKRRQDYDFIIRLAAVARCSSTDQMLWVKTNSPDAISACLDSHLGSILAFYERHPRFHADPSFRRGLSLDVARHFNRTVARRRLGRIPRDAWPLIRKFGAGRFFRMLVEGYGLIRARRAARRRQQRAA